jgi:N-acetylglucosaminyldiphosphoundecaprenol N-acetyl-beta-D-mannosaminyltransferase
VDGLAGAFEQLATLGVPTFVVGHNLHSVYLFHTDLEFRHFYDEADVILTDGFPIALAYGLSACTRSRTERTVNHRLGSTDWIPRIISGAAYSKVAVIGASEQSNSEFLEFLRGLNPELALMGFPGQPWGQLQADEAVRKLGEFRPQLVLVGLGMPLQEAFLHRYRSTLPGAIYATVGGAIDQLAGRQPNAPRWLGRFGLEWLWRLASNPRRLFHRYLIEPWLLIGVLVKHKRSRGLRS